MGGEYTARRSHIVHVSKYRTSANGSWQTTDVWINSQGINGSATVDQIGGACAALELKQEDTWTTRNERYTYIERLRLYSVEIREEGREWDQANGELREIWEGVTRIADAFELAGVTEVNNYERFKKVMVDNQTPFILFVRNAGTSGHCLSAESSNTIQQPDSITCAGRLLNDNALDQQGNVAGYITEHTVVHELGHLFDYRYNNALSNALNAVPNLTTTGSFHAQQANWNGALRNCGWLLDTNDPLQEGYKRDTNNLRLHDTNLARIRVILGITVQYPPNQFRTTWSRGLAGWGTYSAEGQANLTLFQQNPDNLLIEASADMFLNWVYRRTTDNVAGPSGDPCLYALNGVWQGFQNIDIFGNADLQLSGNVRYWWMDQEMQKLLPN